MKMHQINMLVGTQHIPSATKFTERRFFYEFVNIQNHTANANHKREKLYPFSVCAILALF